MFSSLDELYSVESPNDGDVAMVYSLDNSIFNGTFRYENSAWTPVVTGIEAESWHGFTNAVYLGNNGVVSGKINVLTNTMTEDPGQTIMHICEQGLDTLDYMIDTDGITQPSYTTFANKQTIQYIPNLNTGKFSSISGMFNNCRNLRYIAGLNLANCNYIDNAFRNCQQLRRLPDLYWKSTVTSMNSTFYGCNMLIRLPNMNTRNIKNMPYSFAYCTSLTEVDGIDFSNVINATGIFMRMSEVRKGK